MSWCMNCQPCNVNRCNRYRSNATYFLLSCVCDAGGFRIFGFRVGHWCIVPLARWKADFYCLAVTFGQSVHPTITDSQGRVYYDRGAGARGGEAGDGSFFFSIFLEGDEKVLAKLRSSPWDWDTTHVLFTHGWLQVSYAVTFTGVLRHLNGRQHNKNNSTGRNWRFCCVVEDSSPHMYIHLNHSVQCLYSR